jgi:cytochrome d ubiquinol oxidase subunit II
MFGYELSFIWSVLIAAAVFLYVVLDGFDLGVGILFPFAKDSKERDQMMAAVAPVWDGNEAWLLLGGGGLIAAFPKAYDALMPALYMPIGAMLFALVLRGAAFELRQRGRARDRRLWTIAFAGGSMVVAAAQGLALGGFIQGSDFLEGQFIGLPFDWLTPFSCLVAAGVVLGYALLGAAWLAFKTEGPLQERARTWTRRVVVAVGLAMGGVCLANLALNPQITERWGVSMYRIEWATFARVAPLPILAAVLVVLIWMAAAGRNSIRPYLLSVTLFATAYGGLAVSIWPFIVPYEMTPAKAAGADYTLALMLVGAVPLLALILAYTAYIRWVFRAKVPADASIIEGRRT